MTPGTAKQIPIKAGEKPYFAICTEKAGAMNWMDAETSTWEASPKKNLAMQIKWDSLISSWRFVVEPSLLVSSTCKDLIFASFARRRSLADFRTATQNG